MEKKLLREKKLVRNVIVISCSPVTFLFNLLFYCYKCRGCCPPTFVSSVSYIKPSSHVWITIFYRSKREEK